jgi:catechol 2,3-dioxygenase-like lactoylglutathione lyase family enzyme
MIPVHGIQHIGLTVPNMDQAIRFFEEVFGAVTVLETGGLNVDDTYMARKLGVPGDRRIVNIKVLRCGRGGNLELFEYAGEDAGEPLKRNSQPGGFHIAFEVDDARQSADRLREIGVAVLEGPNYVDEGPLKGLTWVYLQAPWGQFLELVSMESLGYEAATSERLWSPRG